MHQHGYGDVVDCTGTCPQGHYCPEGTPEPLPCPAGTFGDTEGLRAPSCSGLCLEGYYCPKASMSRRMYPCPAGRFGAVRGLTTDACSLECDPFLPDGYCVDTVCEPGFYCPAASISGRQEQCGGEHLFCPSGSVLPSPVDPGFYTIGNLSLPGQYQSDEDAKVRNDQVPCEPGTYCINGERFPCPAGRYGATSGLRSDDCTGPCEQGYFCPEQSTNSRQIDCGGPHVFCPTGSMLPMEVGRGNFTIAGPSHNRAARAVCRPGSYCIDGIMRLCPNGTYGESEGLYSPECSGLCRAGYYCPWGSTDPKQRPCPAGRWGTAGMGSELCEGGCSAGYYCPQSSTRHDQISCGAETLYCPPGSGSPRNVSDGFYTTGGTVTTRTGQAECIAHTPPAGTQLREICPSTTAPLYGGDKFYDAFIDNYEHKKTVNEQGVDYYHGNSN